MRLICALLWMGLLPAAGFGADASIAEAAMHQDNAAVRALIQQKADVNAALPDGATALHWAVNEDDLGTVSLLIQAGATSGQLVDGTKLDGPTSLRQALLSRSDVFVRTVTEKLLTYGTGRGLKYYDMPVVRSIARDAAKNDNRFSSLILGIVKSDPFQMRVKAGDNR